MEGEVRIKAAVIDDWISPTSLYKKTGREISVLFVQDGKCTPQADVSPSDSHGTICASILAEALPEYVPLIGYSCPGDDGKPTLDKVCTALEDCLKDLPAYISLSVGSENWLETVELAQLTKKLNDMGTRIFAACANNGHIAFPAAYPWVTGVRYEPGFLGLYWEEKSPVGCNVVVGDFESSVLAKMADMNSFFECRTNSMATPYALGKMLSEGFTVEELPRWEEKILLEPIAELSMPVVTLNGPLEKMRELLFVLQQESYQAALLTDRTQTDWQEMVLHVTPKDFVRWIKPLKEAGILLLDIRGRLVPMEHYGDCFIDLTHMSVEAGYDQIINFFEKDE